MSGSSGRSSSSHHAVVVRAIFVPDGEKPPLAFLSDLNPLRIPATLDHSTGELTSAISGASIDGCILAEWHPDEDQDAGNGEETTSDAEQDTGNSGNTT